MITKAVIVAAGMGRRLQPYTDEMPKCLVPVAGKPILLRQLEAFRAHGVNDIVIVRGYKADVLERRKDELGPGVRFVENPDFQTNNILQSLFHAEAELDGGPFLVSYADIVFTAEAVEKLLASPAQVGLIVDRLFRDVYVGRTDHPLPEAEVCDLDERGAIARVGKRSVPVEQAAGEFIGLARLGPTGARSFVDTYRRHAEAYRGREDQPFHRAPAWRVAYLTDLLQQLIADGVRVDPVFIDGGWREIDTVQDLKAAERALAG
jgi:L-glutamine-phosphate cytidylyltransferase